MTEDVSLQKLGFATKEEISKLSSDDIVNQINGEILRIFAVNSKSDIAAVETKEILAKLDSVFKVREDNQPHVDFPVNFFTLNWILMHIFYKIIIFSIIIYLDSRGLQK